MTAAEFRRCPVTGRTVVLAPARADRPMTLQPAEPHHRNRDSGASCPFCPGAEAETPPELFAIRDDSGWQLRVVPNKFPAVGAASAAFGFHEVLIECPEHRSSPTELTAAQFANIFIAYRERLLHHAADPRVAAVSLFKNVGAEAGASLAHLHSQLVALPFVPDPLARELSLLHAGAGRSPSPLVGEGGGGGCEFGKDGDRLSPFAPDTSHPNPPPQGGREQSRSPREGAVSATGLSPSPPVGEGGGGGYERGDEGDGRAPSARHTPHPNPPPQGGREQSQGSDCPQCRHDPARVVASSPGFVAVCPFAPRFAYETWVLPTDHAPRFETITRVEELATLMKRVLVALDRVLHVPAYNWVLHTAPRGDWPRFHWRIEILPRLSRVAGFEWGTGVFINDTFPERAAAALRDRLTA